MAEKNKTVSERVRSMRNATLFVLALPWYVPLLLAEGYDHIWLVKVLICVILGTLIVRDFCPRLSPMVMLLTMMNGAAANVTQPASNDTSFTMPVPPVVLPRIRTSEATLNVLNDLTNNLYGMRKDQDLIVTVLADMTRLLREIQQPPLPVKRVPTLLGNDIDLVVFMACMMAVSVLTALITWLLVRKCTEDSATRRAEKLIEDLSAMLTRTVAGNQENQRLIPERVLIQSVMQDAPCPRYQAQIELSDDNDEDAKWVYVGNGFRTEHGFVTANHVLEGMKYARISSGEQSKVVKVTSFRRKLNNLDIALLPLSDTVRLDFLTQSKLVSTEVPAMNCTCGDGTQQSFGEVRPGPTFGMVTYRGSTRPGFSGAPYAVNRQVYGMHVGTSGDNMGISAPYLSFVLKRAMYRNEDSDDYMREIVMGDTDYDTCHTGNPDEITIKHKGRYYVVDRDSFYEWKNEKEDVKARYHKAMNRERVKWESVAPPVFTGAKIDYDDSENDCPPVQDNMHGEPSEEKPSPALDTTVPNTSTTESPSPSLGSPSPTEIQELMRALNDLVLKSMLEITLESKRPTKKTMQGAGHIMTDLWNALSAGQKNIPRRRETFKPRSPKS
uniref:Serine protease n=1 Tax=Riboviria sp. TaxID=2585031 RepID=A0A8K1U3X1_9VIRU|nr:MAG: hypothetical protein 2 [Riboviria sp.]